MNVVVGCGIVSAALILIGMVAVVGRSQDHSPARAAEAFMWLLPVGIAAALLTAGMLVGVLI